MAVSYKTHNRLTASYILLSQIIVVVKRGTIGESVGTNRDERGEVSIQTGTIGEKFRSTQGRAGRRVGPEGDFCTSLAGKICSAPIVRPLLAPGVTYGDTPPQWLICS